MKWSTPIVAVCFLSRHHSFYFIYYLIVSKPRNTLLLKQRDTIMYIRRLQGHQSTFTAWKELTPKSHATSAFRDEHRQSPPKRVCIRSFGRLCGVFSMIHGTFFMMLIFWLQAFNLWSLKIFPLCADYGPCTRLFTIFACVCIVTCTISRRLSLLRWVFGTC